MKTHVAAACALALGAPLAAVPVARPQLSLELTEKRLSIVGGPAFGPGPWSPSFAGGVSIAYPY